LKIVFNYKYFKRKFKHAEEAKRLIHYIVQQEKKKLGEINVIFTSNENILEINKAYLSHNYYTDVITFGSNYKDYISGDIYISIDQVINNSERYKTQRVEELFRVIIHGVLHLVGYDDIRTMDKSSMKEKEEVYLKTLSNKMKLDSDELVL